MSGCVWRSYFVSKCAVDLGDGGRGWLEGVGYCFMSILTIASLHQILGRSKWVRCVTRVGGVRTGMCDAWLWAENVDAWRFVKWSCGCITFVCELRTLMCGGSWYEAMDVWRLFVGWEWICGGCWDENVNMNVWERPRVPLACELRMDLWRLLRWKYGCVRTCMCDAFLWALNVDVWRFVKWKYGGERTCVTLVRGVKTYTCEACLRDDTVCHMFVRLESGFVTHACGWECRFVMIVS
jgi:hypothetical protein